MTGTGGTAKVFKMDLQVMSAFIEGLVPSVRFVCKEISRSLYNFTHSFHPKMFENVEECLGHKD